MVSVWHQSTARAIIEQMDPMLSNGSRGTLMSYTDYSVQRCFKLNAPIKTASSVDAHHAALSREHPSWWLWGNELCLSVCLSVCLSILSFFSKLQKDYWNKFSKKILIYFYTSKLYEFFWKCYSNFKTTSIKHFIAPRKPPIFQCKIDNCYRFGTK